eukprot:Selendium_serpulae@DN6235_c0_g1_i1.p1
MDLSPSTPSTSPVPNRSHPNDGVIGPPTTPTSAIDHRPQSSPQFGVPSLSEMGAVRMKNPPPIRMSIKKTDMSMADLEKIKSELSSKLQTEPPADSETEAGLGCQTKCKSPSESLCTPKKSSNKKKSLWKQCSLKPGPKSRVILATEAEQQSFDELLADNKRLKSIRMDLILKEVETRRQLQVAKKKIVELKSSSKNEGFGPEFKANRCVNLVDVADALQAEKDREMEEKLFLLEAENSDFAFKADQYQTLVDKIKSTEQRACDAEAEKTKLEEQLEVATKSIPQPTPDEDLLRTELEDENRRLIAEVKNLEETLHSMEKSFEDICQVKARQESCINRLTTEKAGLIEALNRRQTDAAAAVLIKDSEIENERHKRLCLEEQNSVLQANYQKLLFEREQDTERFVRALCARQNENETLRFRLALLEHENDRLRYGADDCDDPFTPDSGSFPLY